MSTVQSRAVPIQERTDCTASCRLRDHACKCLASVALGDIKLLHKLDSICANPYCIKDEYGRNSLHVAASLGHSDIATRLVKEKCVNVNEPDGESSWTGLHRSAYFGHLETAVELTKLGSEVYAADNDGWSPLDLLNSDMLTHCIGAKELGLSALSTWGVNANATLGHEHSRTVPEQLSIDQKLTVKQVVLCKFHSVFLVSSGEVMTCGLGRGGRLGHGNEHAIMEPTAISALSKVEVVQIDASRNHSVFLDSKGDAYTCGFNEAHQLGQGTNPTTAPHSVLSPLLVKGVRGAVIGVGAGRFHSAFATEVAMYTCGEDHGQLGYKAKYETQIAPRQVPCIELHGEETIALLSVSDAATACLTGSRRIFLCYDYSVRLINVTNQFIDSEMCFTQFSVCATLGDYEKRKKQILSSPVIIAMLSTSGELWYWTMDMKSFHRGSFSGTADSKVKHYTLGKKLTVVTRLGEVFTCDTSSLNQDAGKGSSSFQKMSSGRGRLDLQSSGLLQVNRLGNIQSASCIFTDFKSSNFALVQHFYSPLAKPALEQTHYPDDILSLRQGDQWFMDCLLKVNGHTVPCHRYLLAVRGSVMLPQLEDPEGPCFDGTQPCSVDLSTASQERPVSHRALQVFADYLYCVGIELSLYVSRKEQDRRSVSDEQSVMDSGASSDEPPRSPAVHGEDCDDPFHLSTSNVVHAGTVHQSDYVGLCQLLHHTQVVDPKQGHHRGRIRVLPALPALKYSKSSSVADFFIETSDQKSLPCHRCIIVARSDYFRSMLTMGWKESYQEVAVYLPFSSQLVELVLEYLYSDGIDAIQNIDTEVLMELLVASDQLLISQLRLFCEVELAKRVTLKQVVELAEFAYIYNAHQLFIYCLQLISFNFTYYLAGGYLQGISPEVLTRLSKVYQDMMPVTKRRVMRVSAPADINFVNWLLTSEQDTQPSNVISSTPVAGPVVPAKVQSGTGRKKRRRRVSKGDYAKGQVPPVPIKAPDQQSPTGDKSPDPTGGTKSSTQEVLKEVNSVYTPVADSSLQQEDVSQDQKQVKENRSSKDLRSAFPVAEGDGVKVKVAWKTVGRPPARVNFQKIQHEQASSTPKAPVKQTSRQPKAAPPPKQQLCPAPPKPWPAVPWSGAAVSPPTPPSFLEVMLQEAERETQVVTSPSQSLQHSSSRRTQHSTPVGRGKGAQAASRGERREGERMLPRLSPCGPPPVWSTEAPRSSRKPHSPASPTVSFAAIIADQQKETESQSRHQAKPMEDIELEERAIQQLELLYQVSDCADEWITVERDITLTEKPTWVKECM